MSKIIRLTESDLIKLVQRIVEEEQSTKTNCNVNCMPMTGSDTPESIARKSCCRNRSKKGKESECEKYRRKYKPNCPTLSFLD
jgi:hypothetical protein